MPGPDPWVRLAAQLGPAGKAARTVGWRPGEALTQPNPTQPQALQTPPLTPSPLPSRPRQWPPVCAPSRRSHFPGSGPTGPIGGTVGPVRALVRTPAPVVMPQEGQKQQEAMLMIKESAVLMQHLKALKDEHNSVLMRVDPKLYAPFHPGPHAAPQPFEQPPCTPPPPPHTCPVGPLRPPPTLSVPDMARLVGSDQSGWCRNSDPDLLDSRRHTRGGPMPLCSLCYPFTCGGHLGPSCASRYQHRTLAMDGQHPVPQPSDNSHALQKAVFKAAADPPTVPRRDPPPAPLEESSPLHGLGVPAWPYGPLPHGARGSGLGALGAGRAACDVICGACTSCPGPNVGPGATVVSGLEGAGAWEGRQGQNRQL